MAADHNTNQCLEKHWACLVLEKAIYIYIYACFHPVCGKALGMFGFGKDHAFASFWKRASCVSASGFGKDYLLAASLCTVLKAR